MLHQSEKIDLSIIIPTYNFQDHIGPLWQSLKESSLDTIAKEIIFVNDASSDLTMQFLQELQSNNQTTNIKIINHPVNLGRFISRLNGAKEASGELLFFIDTRIKLPTTAGATIKKLISYDHCLMADIKIDEKKNIFSLYWQRTHSRIFNKSFESKKTPFYITQDNFHQQLSGTGALIVPKSTFLQCASLFDPSMVLSDDNALLEKIVITKPIYFHPDFYVYWEPRNKFLPFFMRMFERGPGFVEFHVFKNQSTFFYIVLLGLIILAGFFAIAFHSLLSAFIIAIGMLLLLALSTFIFGESALESFLMIPVHVGTILFMGVGILWGLLLNSWKFIKSGGTIGYLK